MIAVTVLTIIAGGFAYSMKIETKLARNANNETELLWLGRSGVEYARWILAQQMMIPNEPYDALNQVWAGGQGGMGTSNSPLSNVQREVHLGHGSFTWKITDLESRWNINVAPEPILTRALTAMGADASEVTPVVSSIIDWIDPDNSPGIEGAENEYYEGLSPSYECKNGPIDDISELMLVKNVTPELYEGLSATNQMGAAFQRRQSTFGAPMQPVALSSGLKDLFTPFSTGKLNINTASSAVLQVIPGVESTVADAIVGARGGEDDGSGLAGPFRQVDPNYLFNRVPGLSLVLARQVQSYCDVRSRTFQVEVTATVGGSTRKFYAILGRNNPRDIQVLSFYWKI
jgi:general secretion pathway protein K